MSILEQIDNEYGDKVTVIVCQTNSTLSVEETYCEQIQIPAVIFFKSGKSIMLEIDDDGITHLLSMIWINVLLLCIWLLDFSS